MAKIDISQIEHIAKLSKLSLNSDEKEKFASNLTDILSYVEQLSEIDTKDVEPTANISGLSNVIEDDQVIKSDLGHRDIKLNAPKFKGDAFVVPGVFE